MKFSDYLRADRVDRLLEEIEMPTAAARVISGFVTAELWLPDEVFTGIFSLATGGASVKRVEADLAGTSGSDSLRGVAALLCAALHTQEIYEQKHYDAKIYIDTMKAFSRFVKEYFVSNKCYGFDRFYWMYRALSAHLFRLGTLEFEIIRMPHAIAGVFAEGMSAITVHIPSDARLTREKLDYSYELAGRFMRAHFPEEASRPIHCDTWLLAPALEGMLPADSGIRLFRLDYDLAAANLDDEEYCLWLFGQPKYDRLSDLPEKTSL